MAPSVHVLLDATAIPLTVGGVGRYLEGLVGSFDSTRVRLTIVTRPGLPATVFPTTAAGNIHVLGSWSHSTPLRLLWEQFGLPRLARRLGADVVHSPHYTFPIATRRRRVVTVHDATFFSEPSVHLVLKRLFFRAWTRAAVRAADVIVVPSAATAREIARYTRLSAEDAVVAWHGVDLTAFRPPTAPERIAFGVEWGVGDTWLAFLGTVEPRKNLRSLITALGLLRREGLPVPPLVISGAAGWDHSLDAAIADAGVVIVRTGYLDRDRLPALLGGALVVVYPSLGEGFGLPVLEALACSATVLTTPRLALPEIAGDAVAYAEPDPAALAAALRALLGDPARRRELVERARPHAERFTWVRSARVHEAAYLRAAGSAR